MSWNKSVPLCINLQHIDNKPNNQKSYKNQTKNPKYIVVKGKISFFMKSWIKPPDNRTYTS